MPRPPRRTAALQKHVQTDGGGGGDRKKKRRLLGWTDGRADDMHLQNVRRILHVAIFSLSLQARSSKVNLTLYAEVDPLLSVVPLVMLHLGIKLNTWTSVHLSSFFQSSRQSAETRASIRTSQSVSQSVTRLLRDEGRTDGRTAS